MYALLRGVDVYLYSIYSIADTGTRELLNIKKFEVNAGDDYETSCMRMMREEADVIFVPPLKDADATKQFMCVADRICIIAEMSAKDTSSAIAQLVEWSGDPQLASQVIDAAFRAVSTWAMSLASTLCVDLTLATCTAGASPKKLGRV